MDRRGRLLLLTLLVLAAVVVAWAPWSPREGRAPKGEGPARATEGDAAPAYAAPRVAPDPATLAPGSPGLPTAPSEPRAAESAAALVLHVAGEDGTRVDRALVRLFADVGGQPDGRPVGRLGAWQRALPHEVPRPPSAFWVEVLQPRTADGDALPLASALTGPHAADVLRLDVALPVELALTGRVLDAEGRGLQGASVAALLDRGATWVWEQHGKVVTAEDGSFHVAGLRAGDYRLEVEPVGPNAPPPVEAFPAGARNVLLQCGVGVVVSLVFEDADGAPVTGMAVRVGESRSRGPGRIMSSDAGLADTDGGGQVVFEGLDPDRMYVLEVRIPHDRKDLVPLRSFQWKPASATHRLRRALRVSGRVQYPDGRAFPGARVDVDPVDSTLLGLHGGTRPDGTFVVERVPAGPVRVSAWSHASDADRWVSEKVEAEAGDTDVVLTMQPDPVGTVEVRILDWPSPADTGAGAEPHAYLTAEHEGRVRGSGPPVPVGDDGTVRFPRRHLRRSYTFFVATPSGDRCAYAHHLEYDGKPLSVALSPALSITGRLRVAADAERVMVYASGPGLARAGAVHPDGSFHVTGLPAGTWAVGASARLGERQLFVQGEAEAGGSVDLVLE